MLRVAIKINIKVAPVAGNREALVPCKSCMVKLIGQPITYFLAAQAKQI